MSSINIYEPVDNFPMMMAKNFTWGLIGIILGILVNNFIVYLISVLKIDYLIIQNLIQLFICSFILAIIHYFFNYFGWTWQNITPGLFFVLFFFGIQYNIFTNIQSTYIMIKN